MGHNKRQYGMCNKKQNMNVKINLPARQGASASPSTCSYHSGNRTLRGFSNPVFMDSAFLDSFRLPDLSSANQTEAAQVEITLNNSDNNRQ